MNVTVRTPTIIDRIILSVIRLPDVGLHLGRIRYERARRWTTAVHRNRQTPFGESWFVFRCFRVTLEYCNVIRGHVQSRTSRTGQRSVVQYVAINAYCRFWPNTACAGFRSMTQDLMFKQHTQWNFMYTALEHIAQLPSKYRWHNASGLTRYLEINRRRSRRKKNKYK